MTFWRLFSVINMCCFVIFTDLSFVNNYFNVFENIGFHWNTLSLITTMNLEIFRTSVIQDLLVRRQFSLEPDIRTNVNVKAWCVLGGKLSFYCASFPVLMNEELCRKYRFPLKYTITNYNDEPGDFSNIYLIRIFSAISLNDNWHIMK
jgi:hypothetical protein